MAVRRHGEVRAALVSKGFLEDARRDHAFFYVPDATGRRTSVYTKLSHANSGTDIGSALIGKMARQCRLTKAEFLALVDCTLSEDSYRAKLRAEGHLEE